MRYIKIITVAVFLLVAAVFCAFFSFDRLVLDHTPPMILCDGVPLRVSISAARDELCAGLSASDDVDGDISDRIVIRKVSQLVGSNRALIYYAVFDSSSNYCVFSRSVEYTDYEKPRFSLSKPLIYNVSSTVTLADRLSAYDSLDGEITQRIRLSSNTINNSIPGDYIITVQVTNSAGDTAVANLNVRIENLDVRQPILELSNYLLYLEQGEELTEEALRGLLTNVRESYAGAPVAPENVEILVDVDSSVRGTGVVYYSLKNEAGFEKILPMNVIVE